MIKIFCIFLCCTTLGFGQTESQNAARVSNPDSVQQPDSSINRTTLSDTLQADSTAAEPAPDTLAQDTTQAEPLFDFRRQPTVYLAALYQDSTFIIGSRYTSFGEVFDWFPGGYFYNRAGSGQQAYGSMFGSPPGEFVLSYDRMILNNPINGHADLNLLPVESLAHAGPVHSGFKPFGFLPLGQALQFESHTIANNPIRTQVGYRFGYYDYNDVDARLGILVSPKLWIDAGGVIKSYRGLVANQQYSGNKMNVKINRRLGPNWLARYSILYNVRDTHIPLPGSVGEFPNFVNPREKDVRTDHALTLFYKNRLASTLQYTTFEQDLRAESRGVFNEQHDVRSLRGTGEYHLPLNTLHWRSGMSGVATLLNSNLWGRHGEWQADLYTSLQGQWGKQWHWYARASAQKHQDYALSWQPEVNVMFTPDSTTEITLWANRVAQTPSLKARYSSGPFAFGNLDLTPARYEQLAMAAEKSFRHVYVYGSAAYQRRTQQFASLFDPDETMATYSNIPEHAVLNFDLLLDVQPFKKWRAVFKGNAFVPLEATYTITNRPDLYAKSFLQYHLIYFNGDLNARLRVGASLLGNRHGPQPFYVNYSPSTVPLKPIIYPYLHAILLYGDAEIFIAYENYIDANVQYVYGYSMPQLWLRYGFVWHFVD